MMHRRGEVEGCSVADARGTVWEGIKGCSVEAIRGLHVLLTEGFVCMQLGQHLVVILALTRTLSSNTNPDPNFCPTPDPNPNSHPNQKLGARHC